MIFAGIIANIPAWLAKRREFRRRVAEIESLSQREITDLRADRGHMLRDVRLEMYG